jgi:hypothetical protein
MASWPGLEFVFRLWQKREQLEVGTENSPAPPHEEKNLNYYKYGAY